MDQQDRRNALSCGGCLVSAVGALTALLVWASSDRTRRHMGGGFEGEGTDYGAVLTELPLVALAGALVPAFACVLLVRLMRIFRP
ncbi:hypothetical protein [Streptomyces fulvoviolaceus]|uniref:hypothetical protein n=1 Tax=Streptomyces fulvoviolaceus TaxID=285535 RepID=UPI0004C53F2D|nr:hypothetical protein [Streptomyces fulvoviolaceus]